MAGPHRTPFRYDVFLSHSSADKPVVRELAKRLRAAGLRVWLDEWIIQPGDPISEKIDEGLEQSAVLLLCMSAHAFGSDWVSLEADAALFTDPLNRERRFVPLRLDDAMIKRRLRGYAYIDWRPGADREREWERLLGACRPVAEETSEGPQAVAEEPAAEPEPTPQPPPAGLPAPMAPSPAPSLPSPQPGGEQGLEPKRTRALELSHPGPVNSVSWSGDGQRVVSGGDDGTVSLWEAASGKALAVLEGHKGGVNSVGWSPDGSRVVSGGFDGTVRLWEAASGKALAVLEGHKGWVSSVGWSPDGSRVVSGGDDGTVRLWEAASGKALAVLEGHKGWVSSVGWSPDGSRVVSGGDDGTVRLWEAASGKALAVLKGHKGWVSSVGWSGDGQRVVSGGENGTVRLWETASGKALAVLEGHRDWVRSVGWSPDGSRVVSGGQDGTVRLWEAASGKALAVLKGHKGWAGSVGWSGNSTIWSADTFGLVLVWALAGASEQPPASAADSLTYTNAKVLVVGDSGAGKTGLTQRLATGSFQPSESTVGAWCTQWPLPQPAAPGAVQREVWLWDFGGQADQRLIHQLFLDRADLVLLLFDASREEVLEGLRDWQTALRRTLPDPPPELLVAARVDAGFRASRGRLERFAQEQGMRLLETSALTNSGCSELREAIQAAIPWDQLPRRTSPRLFQDIKGEILRLREAGEVLLTYKDLRERLRQRLQNPLLDDATLQTVIGLLDGPGVLKQLDYGSYVLLKPEWLGVYGQAVLRRLRQAEPQLGALPVGAIAAGDLPFGQGQQRLEAAEEQVLLAELERQLQERKICLRQGGQLVFPSHCGRERPASPALPPSFMSYAVSGWLDDIHATLVVSLAETRVFELRELWRDAAEFRTLASGTVASGRAMAVKLRRDNATEGEITLHVGAEVADAERVQFAQLIDGHLRQAAETVDRRRHWLCPHCHTPKGNEAVLMQKLQRDGEQAQVVCDGCDQPFSLFDDLERLFADPALRRQAAALSAEATPQLTARRKAKLLRLEVGARLTSAGQNWQELSPEQDDGLDLQVEFTDDDGNGTGAFLFLQLMAGPSHLRRRADGREIFAIEKPSWVHTWTQQPFPVMLVIGRPAAPEGWEVDANSLAEEAVAGALLEPKRGAFTSFPRSWTDKVPDRFPSSPADRRAFPDVRWMEISSVLQGELTAGRSPEQIKQIEFNGEPLDMASVLRWRRKILGGWRG